MPAITKSGQPVCNDRVSSEKDKVEHASGLYLIYEDGHVEPFTGDNSKDCVRYIGLKHGYMSFAISLTEHDSVQLLDDDSLEVSVSETYYERECDALFDFGCFVPKCREIYSFHKWFVRLGLLLISQGLFCFCSSSGSLGAPSMVILNAATCFSHSTARS